MSATLDLNGLPVSFVDRGAGRPILFLHGATQDRSVWTRQLAHFRHTHRVLAYDMRGHGDTPLGEAIQSGRDVLTVDRLADDCIDFIDALGLERPVLCGVSLGGMVALQVAARAPDRVGAFVLANTPIALSLNSTVLRIIDALNPYAVLVPLLRYVEPMRVARIGTRCARIVFGPGWARGEGTERFIAAFGRMSPKALIETYRAICEVRLPDLTGIDRVPTLVVTGEDEAGMIFRHAAEIARMVGTAELATIPGGHVSNLDSPREFNRALAAFFERWLETDQMSGPSRRMASATSGSIRPS